jgi:putative transposase
MVKNHHLAKSISDAGWGQFIMIVVFKAEEAGRKVIKVNPSYTSQDCSRCGHRNRITLATRIYRCRRRGVACEEPRTYRAADLESPAKTR